jgi:hypothetical protein
MDTHKNEGDLARMPSDRLLALRRELAAGLGDVEHVLAGSLAEQSRRCGKAGCRCADGEPHGPYAYFTPRPGGRGRARYVPAPLAGAVARCLQRAAEVEDTLARISAVNAELLARRELE